MSVPVPWEAGGTITRLNRIVARLLWSGGKGSFCCVLPPKARESTSQHIQSLVLFVKSAFWYRCGIHHSHTIKELNPFSEASTMTWAPKAFGHLWQKHYADSATCATNVPIVCCPGLVTCLLHQYSEGSYQRVVAKAAAHGAENSSGF